VSDIIGDPSKFCERAHNAKPLLIGTFLASIAFTLQIFLNISSCCSIFL